MRFAYSAQASSAQPGSLALSATTRSLGTRFGLLLRRGLPRSLELHRLATPQLLQIVEVAHRGMHDVNDDVAQVDQHPFAAALALDAIDPPAERPDPLLHAVGERLHLAVGVAARDHHA